MVKFLFIRVVIFSTILAVISFFISGNRVEVPVGILIGGVTSVYKVRLFTVFLNYLAQNGKKTLIKSVFLNLFSQSLALIILVAAMMADKYLFFGVAVGLVSTALVICLNGLTEKAGLTHNNWQNTNRKV